MSRLFKAAISCLLAGIFGVLLIPFTLELEESLGLHLLFKLRGAREVPSDVVVVTLDKLSADHLSLKEEPEHWPRSLHARLTESLTKAGAEVIAFDLIFDESHSAKDDVVFAEAIKKANNVVLCECIKKEVRPLIHKDGKERGELDIVTLMTPIPSLAEPAVALAPFPLPKVPVKVSQYWTIKASAGDTPTLPVVVFQLFALHVYEEFIRLLEKVSPDQAKDLPADRDAVIADKGLIELIREVRAIFRNNPGIAGAMLKELDHSKMRIAEAGKKQLLASLIKMYHSAESQHLNFYGPPGTIETVPYYQVVQAEGEAVPDLDVAGKAVFVGLSEQLRPEQRDGFHTVFTQESGLDLSGVEIAATAFANLLENMPVRPRGVLASFAAVFLWGVALGLICYFSATTLAAVSVIALSTLYLLLAYYQFTYTGIWYPLVVPLLFQVPSIFFGTFLFKYLETNKERENIKKAFGHYLPPTVVDQVARNVAHIGSSGNVVYGTCLSTDAERYSTLSETMEPTELRAFMNRYYKAVFGPVKRHGGIVSDVIGDSMLALWAAADSNSGVRNKACHAALDIAGAINQFNQSSDNLHLPTRIGLHSGQILLGNIGAVDHYEYRPVGDIVNTVSRIEGLNKYLGTWILATEEVLAGIDGFLTREMGSFVLVGKSKPVTVHELLCRTEDANEDQKNLCSTFCEGLEAYRNQSWEEALNILIGSMKIREEDGPSKFYSELCKKYREKPPEGCWAGTVCLNGK